jgi:hypothetical protein
MQLKSIENHFVTLLGGAKKYIKTPNVYKREQLVAMAIDEKYILDLLFHKVTVSIANSQQHKTDIERKDI